MLLGVRQGKSPFLFSMYLHDIKEHYINDFDGIDWGFLNLFYCHMRTILWLCLKQMRVYIKVYCYV